MSGMGWVMGVMDARQPTTSGSQKASLQEILSALAWPLPGGITESLSTKE